MKLFACAVCGHPLNFETARCESCGTPQGLDSEAMELVPAGVPGRGEFLCANAGNGGCNWLTEPGETFCPACRYNRMIPDLSIAANEVRWRRIEVAKRRLFYSLFRLGLRPETRLEAPDGLVFDFLADPPDPTRPVMTGHADGLITVNVAEADDVERERRREALGESYRTLLGHFRHEIAHYFWGVMTRDPQALQQFREAFGDERPDYGESLQSYYRDGPPDRWQDFFISAYASAHPWEDFAETWAHYFHMVDTLETAGSLRILADTGEGQEPLNFDAYVEPRFDRMVEAWMRLAYGLNLLNRSMGMPDLYPFQLSPPAVYKLSMVHMMIRRAAGRTSRPDSSLTPLKAMAAGLSTGMSPPAEASLEPATREIQAE
ncbi:hypothetical protein SLNSH_16860 [Alsobacter soli]|uniref:Zinc-ribbon domain-containing protein n=1 Tax=Alsobacter soli TaxID=2109933 RepID=A0A2T1HQB4_9HYPH|nr:putative zinc-binding metallopeptidase [Alsobacter soli]PSC03851.1 hypothetical protein SLNSH_16860 [Alsobacter soli]